jgi:hypothetical protein
MPFSSWQGNEKANIFEEVASPALYPKNIYPAIPRAFPSQLVVRQLTAAIQEFQPNTVVIGRYSCPWH